MGTWGRNTNSRHIFRNLQSVPSASYLTHTLPFKLSPTVNMSGSDDNGSPGAQEKPEAGASEHLNIKGTTQLKKLMDAFCERQGKAPNSVRFLFDGSRVQPTDSPDTLDVADGDTLEVHQEQIGGGI